MPPDSRSLLHRAKWQPGRPCIADVFCCQGGIAEGYWRAGFNVIGFDELMAYLDSLEEVRDAA